MTKTIRERYIIKSVIVAIIVLLIVGYGGLKTKDLVAGPSIVLYSPLDGSSLKKELVNIKGKAQRISKIYLNGRKIFTDEKGNFNESLLLANGYNIFEIKAEDQFGREVTKTLQLVYDHKEVTQLN